MPSYRRSPEVRKDVNTGMFFPREWVIGERRSLMGVYSETDPKNAKIGWGGESQSESGRGGTAKVSTRILTLGSRESGETDR